MSFCGENDEIIIKIFYELRMKIHFYVERFYKKKIYLSWSLQIPICRSLSCFIIHAPPGIFHPELKCNLVMFYSQQIPFLFTTTPIFLDTIIYEQCRAAVCVSPGAFNKNILLPGILNLNLDFKVDDTSLTVSFFAFNFLL